MANNVEVRRRQKGGPPDQCFMCPLRSYVLYAPAFDRNANKLGGLRRGTITFAPRQVMARQGDLPREVYSLFSGWAFQYRLLDDGRRQIFSLLLPGDFVGVQPLNQAPFRYSVQALTEVEVCMFATDELADLFHQEHDLMDRIMARFYEDASFLASRLVDIGRRTATERITRFILEIENRLRSRGLLTSERIPFPLRQTHIADALGLTPVHVSRTINALRREGLISFERRSITIHDKDALKEVAGWNCPG